MELFLIEREVQNFISIDNISRKGLQVANKEEIINICINDSVSLIEKHLSIFLVKTKYKLRINKEDFIVAYDNKNIAYQFNYQKKITLLENLKAIFTNNQNSTDTNIITVDLQPSNYKFSNNILEIFLNNLVSNEYSDYNDFEFLDLEITEDKGTSLINQFIISAIEDLAILKVKKYNSTISSSSYTEEEIRILATVETL